MALPRRGLEFRTLTVAERHAVVERARAGDPAAREEVVRLYGGLVHKVAARYGSHLPQEDRYQAAWVGIWSSLSKWNVARGSFSTFASWHARYGLSRWGGGSERFGASLPTTLADAVYSGLVRAEKLRPEIRAQDIAGDPEKLRWFLAECVRDRRVTIKRAKAALLAGAVYARPDEAGEWWDGFFGANEASQEEAVSRAEAVGRVRAAVAHLEPGRLKVIAERRLLGEARLEDLGQEFGVTRERVRQLELQVKERLGELLEGVA